MTRHPVSGASTPAGLEELREYVDRFWRDVLDAYAERRRRRVTAREPPGRLAFTWHPGREDDTATQVEVTFTAAADGTEVRLVHTGWEVLGDRGPEVRERYVTGWAMVLGQRYAATARVEDAR